MNAYVTKRQDNHFAEKFDPLKLHSSVTAACLAVRAYEGEAHLVAQHVSERVLRWLKDKTEVTSADIRRVASEVLRVYHPEAAFVYEHYGIML